MISVTILVKNGEFLLKEVLASLEGFKEVILYDTGSTDRTLEIAKNFKNVVIHNGEFQGFGQTHNIASQLAANDWILSIDSDEILTKELAEEIACLSLDLNTVYSIRRQNFFNGKKIKWCGWQNDAPIRLYNRKRTAFSENKVHEGIMGHGMKHLLLKHFLLHFPYRSINDFLKKMEHYSTLFAEEHYKKKKSSPFIAFKHGAWAFFKSYILKKGFLGGYEGYLISLYNGQTAFYKYLKLYHLNDS